MNIRSRQVITGSLVLVALSTLAAATILGGQADSFSVPEVKCVIGLPNFNPGTTGTISLKGDTVSFETTKKKGEIKVTQISDIFAGNESRQDISGLGGTAMKAAIPYGGGRILSLFSHKVEVMTILFTDANGAFHGAIFVLPVGHATELRSMLVARGAKVTQHVEPPAPAEEPKQ